MEKEFAGLTAIITGAGSGIGLEVAKGLKGHGAIVYGFDINEGQMGSVATFIKCDIGDASSVETAFAEFRTVSNKLDILVNNAGLAAGLSSIEEGSLDDWERMIDTNVKGLLYISRKILPLLKQQRSGHVFNISSTAGKIIYKNGNVYCATKHAVDALSQAMRIDLLPYGIKVTCISPGMAETEFSLVRFNGNEEKAKQVYTDTEPLQAHDIADTVAYCANLPTHVCINDLTITCLNQANGIYVQKNADKL